MLLHLKEVFKDIAIINPYVYFVIDFLKNSAFHQINKILQDIEDGTAAKTLAEEEKELI